MLGLLKTVFGSENDRSLKALRPIVAQINALEDEFVELSDAELQEKTNIFRTLLNDGKTLNDILPQAFATVREAAKRTLKQRHYDVQLLGGIILHKGMIAEMKTGEGKTLVSTLPTYLNALSGKGVHVVTVNDYLAKRDSEWMGQIHRFLGLTVGCIYNDMDSQERKEAYKADITYGTNNEFGFDYLRDNLKFSIDEIVQRDFNYAIIDEVDSILIDEARTPLVISGSVEDNSDLYVRIDKLIPALTPADYEIDEKDKNVNYTDEGIEHIEKLLTENKILEQGSNLFDISNLSIVHHINQALKAHLSFKKDKDYIVHDGKLVIIDEFTGRMMEGRRFSEGLHQALEAKENVTIQNENQTLASVTFQNYFRLYPKLSGMTGTAATEADEFADIYDLKVMELPTNIAPKRIDDDDDIYRTEGEKYAAIIELIQDCHKHNQPVLAGTASIEQSEKLSKLLKKQNIKHNILNARHHENEAHIIAQAGTPGAITIATNMAGRGTDIQLGGNEEMLAIEATKTISDKTKRQKVIERIKQQITTDKEIVRKAGGLCIIGTERHESRRIDNQLRGRAGRQGDEGYTKFFLSAEDDLIRIFGADKKMDWVLGTMGEAGQPIAHPILTKMMSKSQQKVEARNYEIRKNLLKFDDVMNDQRKVIFDQRLELMHASDADETIHDMSLDIIEDIVAESIPEKSYSEQWDIKHLQHEVSRIYGLKLPIEQWAKQENIADQEIKEKINQNIEKLFNDKKEKYSQDLVQQVYQRILLFALDDLWKGHLLSLDHLRQGIGLRGYGQKDPLNEYKKESFAMFEQMLHQLREIAVTRAAHMEMQASNEGEIVAFSRDQIPTQEIHDRPTNQLNNDDKSHVTSHTRSNKEFNRNDPSTWGRVGRNEPCPCKSGKKYKQCHGKIQ